MNTATHVLAMLTPAQVDRFWSKVTRGDDGECWLWSGALHERGYGTWTVNKPDGRSTSVRPHRVAWTLLRGQIPDGLVLDHLCERRACCNPAHLEVVGQSTNVSRIRHLLAPAPLPRLIAALLLTHDPDALADWWAAWLGSNDYDRRRAERAAIDASALLNV